MKNIIYVMLVIVCLLTACEPENPVPNFSTPGDGTIRVFDMESDNSFLLVNGLLGRVLPPRWNFGNGQTAVGDSVYVGYAFTGTYTVRMTYFDGEREVVASKDIRITQDNMALVSDPVYELLTGGLSESNGKTWVLDSLRTGHVRLWRRQTGQESDDKKAPLFYGGTGMYDDEITFKLLGAECNYNNKGRSYSHGGTIDGVAQFRIEQLRQMGTVTGVAPSPRGDFLVNYTPSAQPQRWSMTKRTETVNGEPKEVYYLKLTGGAYMFFYRGNSPSDIEYKIESIDENHLHIVHYETFPASRATARWEDHYLLVRKGYPIQPETPAVPDPPKADNIFETFEGTTKSLTFTYFNALQTGWMGLPSYSVVRNVSMTGINPSDSIARFVRGTGYDEQLKLTRNHTIDLSQKNKLKMMVYLPSTNNYLNVNLKPTIEVRLVNSKNVAQTVVKTITVAPGDFNKWIEVVFDFSDSADITTLDTWIIQFGGQYPNGTNASPGIFYFDNLSLTN